MSLSSRVVSFIFERNRILLTVLLLVLGFLAAGIPRIEVSDNSRNFLGSSSLEFVEFERIESTYTTTTLILVMLRSPERTAFDPETLTSLQSMAEDAWRMPYVLRVDLPINQLHIYADGDDVFVEPMLDAFDDITAEAAERFRKLALASDDMRNILLSEDGRTFGISIRVVLPQGVRGARFEVEDFLNSLLAKWEAAQPEWEIRATGSILGNNLLSRVAIEDIFYLVPIALIAVVALFILAMGSVVPVFASLVVLIGSTLATYGFAGWAGIELTAGTAISPLAVMVLISTSCIHINLTTVRFSEAGQTKTPFQDSITKNFAPILVSHLTTGMGFLCLNFSPSPPLADKGNILAFGLLIGLFSVFIILPAILSNRPTTKTGRFMLTGESMRRLCTWVIRNRALLLLLFPVLMIIAVLGIRNIEYDDNVIRYFDERYELRQDSEAIQLKLTGLETLQFSFRAPEGVSIFDPEFLRRVDRFKSWIERRPEVVAVNSLTTILSDLNRKMSGGGANPGGFADTQAANAQLMMFYELSLPVGMDLNVLMDVERTQTLVTATVRVPHSVELRTLAEEADAWIAKNDPSLLSRASGAAITFARLSEHNNSQMIWGFLTALAMVSVTLIVTLRSLRYGLLSLVPNLLPALLGLGFWGVFVGDVNLGSTVVTTMTFGIVVDDTVHFLMHYLACRRKGLDVEPALADTYEVVGSAIILTSISLMLGFLIMATSGYVINQHMGLLTSVVIFFALLSDLFMLPAVLTLFRKKRDRC